MLFLYLTAEVFTAGALLPMHRSLGAPVGAVGALVTVYAVVAASAALPMTAISTRVRPQLLLPAAMVLLALSQTGIAVAPTLAWVSVLRGCSALFHGAIWASAPTVAAALLPGRPGRATATVFAGSALGNVLGAPLVSGISALVSWRIASLVLAALALGCALALARSVPRTLPASRSQEGTSAEPDGAVEGRTRVRRIPGASVLAVARWCGIVVLVASAHLTVFTFLAERAGRAGVTGTGFSVLLMVMGIAGLVGTLVMARVNDALPRLSTLVAMLAMSLALLVVALGVGPLALGAAVAVWGTAYSALIVALQAFVLRDAAEWPQLASSWYVLFFQVGIAAGSGLGALVIARTADPQLLALIGACLTGTALIVAAVLTRPERRVRDGPVHFA